MKLFVIPGQDAFRHRHTAREVCVGLELAHFMTSAMCDEDMTSMHMAKHGEWCEDEGVQQGFSSREEGPKLIRFESPRWRPKTTQVRVHLGVQEQPAP